MVVILLICVGIAVACLGLIGYHAFQLHMKVARLDTRLGEERVRYEHDGKEWSNHAAKLKTQYQAVVAKYNDDTKRLKDYAAALKLENERLCEQQGARNADAKAQYQFLVAKYNEDTRSLNECAAALRTENERLSKWESVADAETQANDMLRTAQESLTRAKTESSNLMASAEERATSISAQAAGKAESLVANARQSAETLLSEAKAEARKLREDAQGVLGSATAQAARILECAGRKAEEIGGSAYAAMQNASQYERTVRAMKNMIEGYSDEYIIPQQSLLDDLADDFSHTKAGQELKRAREQTKIMIRNRTAATCAYVEANRRDTAVNFVVDAFNGKADSILSRVKHDNAGKLQQQMRDAFTLVNYNGKAFRDAQITEEFLAARLEELKWSAIVQQLALEEREEQRRVKEQIREEARAMKERERALREAAKEEETLRRAMEQAREEVEHATGEQKAMYEQRLQEMAARLSESEERKERARSMAEQTKKGYVYIISNVGSFGEDVYKIGLTRRWDPLERVRELGDSSVPFGFDVHAVILSDDAPALEQQLHEHFRLGQINKANHRKEFFRASLSDIRNELELLGVTNGIHWTLTAEAKEYRESLAIEQAIAESPAERESWVRRQRRVELAATCLAEPVDGNGEDDEE